jgi:integrase
MDRIGSKLEPAIDDREGLIRFHILHHVCSAPDTTDALDANRETSHRKAPKDKLGCGLRRAELTILKVEGGHIRTIPVPDWVKAGIDAWIAASGVAGGILLRSINKAGRVWGAGVRKVIWGVVKEKAKICEIPALAPHDLRRTCAVSCHQAAGELEQIQFLLGHVSVQTTERYLGCKQRFHNAVNDRIGLEPDPAGSS